MYTGICDRIFKNTLHEVISFRKVVFVISILTPRVSVDNDALRRLEKKVHDLETLDRKHLDKIEKLQSENKISKEEKDDLLTRYN